jgi:outer membrane protein assembly factor BamB
MALLARRNLCLASFLTLLLAGPAWSGNWPQWRGPTGDSVSDETGLPLKWDEKTNIVWKCRLPEWGASTPAIWGDAIFVTTQDRETLYLLKINKKDGKMEWTRRVGTGTIPRLPLRKKSDDERRSQRFHDLHNMASPSPVTDGEVVIAHFGNGDLAAYDFAGKQLWTHNLQKEHGNYTIWWGHANSPVLYKNLVISACMQDSLADLGTPKTESYLVALDIKSGKQEWKSLRMTGAAAEECDSYTTPVFHKTQDGGVEMIVMGGNQIDGYDPATGKQLWYLPGIKGGRTITGPTIGADLAYCTQGMKGPLLAVRLGGEGKLDPTKDVAWKQTQGTPDSSTPVVWKDWLFWVSDNGFAHCVDARTGELKWKERLPGDYKPSPLAAEGRIYFLNLKDHCTVVAASAKFEKLAENQIDDDTIASPAISDGRIYLRGHKALYCIGVK